MSTVKLIKVSHTNNSNSKYVICDVAFKVPVIMQEICNICSHNIIVREK